jgi:Zn-dependent protease
VTLNPLAHIDPIGTLLFPLVGFLAGGFIFGWAKPVPVNVSKFKDPRFFHVLVAAAGPGSNILAAIVFLVLLKSVQLANPGDVSGTLWEPILLFFRAGLVLNIILAVFNLIPVPPLDGSWILEGVLPQELGKIFSLIRPYGFLLLLLLFYTGVFGSILRPILSVIYKIAL